MSLLLRRTARAVSVLLIGTCALLGIAATAPAGAAPVVVPYTCSSPDISGSLEVDLAMEQVGRTKMYVGTKHAPKLVVRTTVPGNIVFLAALANVRSASATGTMTVKVNGKDTVRPFVFPRTDIPQSATPMAVTVDVPLATLAPTGAGSVTYKPGPVVIALTGYNKTVAEAQDGDEVGTANATCATSSTRTIGAVAFVKSPTRTTARLTKVGAKVRSTAVVGSTSKVAPVGTVTTKVYRGKKLLLTRTVAVAKGSAVATFPRPARKGRYQVVVSYGGSRALLPSKVTRTFTVA